VAWNVSAPVDVLRILAADNARGVRCGVGGNEAAAVTHSRSSGVPVTSDRLQESPKSANRTARRFRPPTLELPEH